MTENLGQIQKAVETLHKCRAQFVRSSFVCNKHEDKVVWEGIVHTFKIMGNPQAKLCYAWASPIEGSTKNRFYAVLHVSPVDSPEKAVKAAIVQDFKTGYTKP